MPSPDETDEKASALLRSGTLNRSAQDVTDALFRESDFFDARDLVQVRYEMLRRVDHDGLPVTAAAERFGVSRPTYYQARTAFDRAGLEGLLPRKRGPRGGHKLTAEVTAWLAAAREADPALTSEALASLAQEHFAVHVHRRSVERALRRLGERRR